MPKQVLIVILLLSNIVFAGAKITIEKPGISVDRWNSANISSDYLSAGGLRIGDETSGTFKPVYRFNVPKLGVIASLRLRISAIEYNSGDNEGTDFRVGKETVWDTYTQATGSSLETTPQNGVVGNWLQSDDNPYLDYIEVYFENTSDDDIEIHKLSMTIEYANISESPATAGLIAKYQLLCNLHSTLNTYRNEMGPVINDIVNKTNEDLIKDGIQKACAFADALSKINGFELTDLSANDWGSWIVNAKDIKDSLSSFWNLWETLVGFITTINNLGNYPEYVGTLDGHGKQIYAHLGHAIPKIETLTEKWQSAIVDGNVSVEESSEINQLISNALAETDSLKTLKLEVDEYANWVLQKKDIFPSFCKTHIQCINPFKTYNSQWQESGKWLANYVQLLSAMPFTTHTISGYVRDSSNNGISGVIVSANTGGTSAITSSSGYYSIGINSGWTGVIVPSREGYDFSPSIREYFTPVTANQTNTNFTGMPQKGSLQVSISPGYVAFNAQWRLTAGPDITWKQTGNIISDILVGSYTIEFNNLLGWESPPTQTVMIGQGENQKSYAYQDITPPTPNPAQWLLEPAGVNAIKMMAVVGTDINFLYFVSYCYFEEITGNPGGDDSGWIEMDGNNAPIYIDDGLQADTIYTYRVKMKDYFGNETEWSEPKSFATPKGTGTQADPFLIYTAEQFDAIAVDQGVWDKCFKLMADIDMTGTGNSNFHLIGDSTRFLDSLPSFSGVFDGNGHKISNFNLSGDARFYNGNYDILELNNFGLFSFVDGPNAVIKNLTLINPTITTAAGYCGGLIGYLGRGKVSNCHVENAHITGGGGLIGLHKYYDGDLGDISDCSVTGGMVFGGGGLIGVNYCAGVSVISNCHSSSTVTGGGGLIGSFYSKNGEGRIENCYATGDVNGDGGLVGSNDGADIINCYATGNVYGSYDAGGLVGAQGSGHIMNSYATGNVSGNEYVGGLAGYNGFWGAESSIENCFATGNICGGNMYYSSTGGLVGFNFAPIKNCYAKGSVQAPDGDWSAIGGVVGQNQSEVKFCYFTGSLSGEADYIGGVTGWNSGGGYTNNSFYNIDTCGQLTSTGGKGKTTSEMQTLLTFFNAGWDFIGESSNGTAETWRMCSDGHAYPRLSMEFYNYGDFVCPDGVGVEDMAILAEQWLCEELSYDIVPRAGDGIVNFFDWAVFANTWHGDTTQLVEFTGQWLKSSNYNATVDINGDGIVNMLDFSVLAEHWLSGQ